VSAFAGIRDHPDGIVLDLKVVPGARGDSIVGPLGDRLKLRISAPPEGGRANTAVIDLIAERLDIPSRDLRILSGSANHEKTLLAVGMTASDARRRLLGAE
jgi:uncharacterized protein (TIGR00251 family)